MLLTTALAVVLAALVMPVAAADGPGSCGKGEVWDADQGKCVSKPRGSGSGAGSHAG
jgi:hypothetical protein